jgi:hypothetical protein
MKCSEIKIRWSWNDRQLSKGYRSRQSSSSREAQSVKIYLLHGHIGDVVLRMKFDKLDPKSKIFKSSSLELKEQINEYSN